MNKRSIKRGFTLIEVLVVIGIIAILAAVVLVAVNPSRQFALARNSQRTSNVAAILNAISQNMVDNHGTLTCNGVALSITESQILISKDRTDLRSCLVPNYLSELPIDPSTGSLSDTTYNTGYTISRNVTTNRITVSSPDAELGQTISITR